MRNSCLVSQAGTGGAGPGRMSGTAVPGWSVRVGRLDVHVHVVSVAGDAGGEPGDVVVVDEHVPVAQVGDGHLDPVADDGVVGGVDGAAVTVAVIVGRDAEQGRDVVAVVVELQ